MIESKISVKIPYLRIMLYGQLTKEDLEQATKFQPSEWFESNGQRIFNVIDDKGVPTGDYCAYLILR